MMEMVYEKYSTLLTEFIGPALTTILPILFQYCYKCCYSDNRSFFFSKKGGPPKKYLIRFFSLEL